MRAARAEEMAGSQGRSYLEAWMARCDETGDNVTAGAIWNTLNLHTWQWHNPYSGDNPYT